MDNIAARNSKVIQLDLLSFRKKIRQYELDGLIERLHHSNTLKTLCSFSLDWAVIATSIVASLHEPWILPIALVLIGSRQRALSNLVHDASHGNLFRSREINDLMANIFAALPMFETVDLYKKSHLDHHAFLGTNSDPDYQSHIAYGYNDAHPEQGSAFKQYMRLSLNLRSIRDSVVGSLFRLKFSQLAAVGCWWAVLLTIIAIIGSVKLAALSLAVWVLSRLTGYHFVRIFAEFLDHTGLRPGSILEFTRTIPGASPLRVFFHPHFDQFHLIHHLLPGVPHYNLPVAYKLLSQLPEYSRLHNCTGYFMGPHSAIDCWMGRCGDHGL